jgi:hypothetical protein
MDRSLTPVLPHLGRLGHSLGHSIYMVLLLYSLSVLVVLVTETEGVKRGIEKRYRAAKCRTGCVAVVTGTLPKIGKFVCGVQRLSVFFHLDRTRARQLATWPTRTLVRWHR